MLLVWLWVWGIGFEYWVGVLLECCLEMVVVLLVVLDVGVVYVLIDLDYLVVW